MGHNLGKIDKETYLSGLGIFCELFGVSCANKYSGVLIKEFDAGNAQSLLEDNYQKLVIGRDLLAFIFIIFQLRILHSHFFQRCAIDYRCELVQASR